MSTSFVAPVAPRNGRIIGMVGWLPFLRLLRDKHGALDASEWTTASSPERDRVASLDVLHGDTQLALAVAVGSSLGAHRRTPTCPVPTTPEFRSPWSVRIRLAMQIP